MAAPSAAHAACAADAQTEWRGVTVMALAAGDTCAAATAGVSVVFISPSGDVLWESAFSATELLGFQQVGNRAALARALRVWLAQPAATSAAALPAWPAGADGPFQSAEFRFSPANDLGRARYEAIRAAAWPIFQLTQGQESLLILGRDPASGSVRPLGVQAFPG